MRHAQKSCVVINGSQNFIFSETAVCKVVNLTKYSARAPVDHAGAVMSQTVRGDCWRLSFLIQVNAETPARRVLVVHATHPHARPRLYATQPQSTHHRWNKTGFLNSQTGRFYWIFFGGGEWKEIKPGSSERPHMMGFGIFSYRIRITILSTPNKYKRKNM